MERTKKEQSKQNFKTISSSGALNERLSAIDGPPIDFSFKNMRRLEGNNFLDSEMEGILNNKTLTIKPK